MTFSGTRHIPLWLKGVTHLQLEVLLSAAALFQQDIIGVLLVLVHWLWLGAVHRASSRLRAFGVRWGRVLSRVSNPGLSPRNLAPAPFSKQASFLSQVSEKKTMT